MQRKPRKASAMAQMYRNVFAGTEGQKVLADIMAHCRVFAPIAPGDDFALGERNVGLMIATKLNYHESEFHKLAHQHNEVLIHD